MKITYKCVCGEKFATQMELMIHLNLLRPSSLRESRLLPWITPEKVAQREKEILLFEKNHGRIEQ
jgi:hypothetical protein